MKKSELRQLIREEIESIQSWDKLSQRLGLDSKEEAWLMDTMENSKTTREFIEKIKDEFSGGKQRGLVAYYKSNPIDLTGEGDYI